MSTYRHHIETIINEEKSTNKTALARLLFLGAECYGMATRLKEVGLKRHWLQTRRLPCPVLSIGNLTVGGTGKTPLTLYTARMLSTWGYRVAILSRGYKGSCEKIGAVVSDGRRIHLSAQQAGDEPLMMATELRNVPVLVGQNRFKNGQVAIEAFGSNIIVLDDGFQHRRLERQIDLLLVDHHRGFGNRFLLPRGPLREPLSAITRAHAIIETRAGDSVSPAIKQVLSRYGTNTPVFQCKFSPSLSRVIEPAAFPEQESTQSPPLKTLSGQSVYGFSGLADNRKFHNSLTALEAHVTGLREFPDHHWYTPTDLSSIQKSAMEAKADMIATTQKDWVRIPKEKSWPIGVAVIGIETDFGNQTNAFHQFIKDKLTP